MSDKKDNEEKVLDENVELSYDEKVSGQLDCLKEMNKILKGAIERHETNRNNN